MEVTRRGLLAGAAVGGGLLVAWALWPRSYDPPLSPGRGEWAFGAWLKIARDGVVTVAVPQLEMGQGVTTVLPQVVAVELGADWRQIAVEPAPVSGAYANIPLAAKWAPLWMPVFPGLADDPDDSLTRRLAEEADFVATADGTSLAAFEQPCREAAAAARAMLMQAAADRWGVAYEECDTAAGFVVHGGERLSFAELAEAAASYDPPNPAPLRPEPAAQAPLPGEGEEAVAFPRLDLPAKVDGSFLFAGDVRLPGMLYAAIRHGPVGDAQLLRFDVAAAEKVAGVKQIVRAKRWIAALGETWWAAERALEALDPVFRTRGAVSSGEMERMIDKALRDGQAARIATRGEGDGGLGKPDLTLRYEIAPATHATLETASATARLAAGRLELWLASQAPERARLAAAKAAGVDEGDTVLYPTAAGGSFDRRLEHDHAIEAAILAREASPRPVQLVWSRWQEALAGRPRQPLAALVSGWTAAEGAVEGLRLRVAMPAAAREFGERLFDDKTAVDAIEATAGDSDPLAFEDALPPYAIPAVAIDHVPARTGLPAGRLRGNSHAWLAFLVESFIDELAARAGREPLSYRIEMLGQDARLAECLQRAARLAEWDGGARQSGQGVACWRIGEAEAGGRIACVATARAGEGGVKVARLAAAVDIGRIVNLDIARQQIEGGLIFGMSLALGSALTFEQGLPTNGRLAALDLPVLADSPEIALDFVSSTEPACDAGELGVAVAAPAIANALHSATGLRLRRLPLLSGGL